MKPVQVGSQQVPRWGTGCWGSLQPFTSGMVSIMLLNNTLVMSRSSVGCSLTAPGGCWASSQYPWENPWQDFAFAPHNAQSILHKKTIIRQGKAYCASQSWTFQLQVSSFYFSVSAHAYSPNLKALLSYFLPRGFYRVCQNFVNQIMFLLFFFSKFHFYYQVVMWRHGKIKGTNLFGIDFFITQLY